MSLKEEIRVHRQSIRADSYPMSIGELVNIYSNNEIDIHPEFQRFYRWTIDQKTKLVESILLGIPIPSIFVAQREDGIWDVIDGLQRLSTIFEFIGILKDEDGNFIPPLKLERAQYLPSLENKYWSDFDNTYTSEQCLDNEQRIDFKRTKINISILQKESDPNAKYELFQRLNTGGSQLSPQEVRNCIFVMINKEYYYWLHNLSKNEEFQSCVSLSERLLEERYDMELILRFFLLQDDGALERIRKSSDFNLFLTDEAKSLALNPYYNYKDEEFIFNTTFYILNKALGSDTFRRYDSIKKKFTGAFLVSAFEVIAVGIAKHIRSGSTNFDSEFLTQKVKDLWSNSTFQSISGSGTTAKARSPKTAQLGFELFKNEQN